MDNKTTAAVAAAVFEYIRSEEEAVCLQAAGGGRPAQSQAAGPAAQARLWGVSGRQQQMQLRNLMQWRAFAGTRRI